MELIRRVGGDPVAHMKLQEALIEIESADSGMKDLWGRRNRSYFIVGNPDPPKFQAARLDIQRAMPDVYAHAPGSTDRLDRIFWQLADFEGLSHEDSGLRRLAANERRAGLAFSEIHGLRSEVKATMESARGAAHLTPVGTALVAGAAGVAVAAAALGYAQLTRGNDS